MSNLRTIKSLMYFSLAIILLPIGIFHWAYKSIQVNKRTRARRNNSVHQKASPVSAQNEVSTQKVVKAPSNAQKSKNDPQKYGSLSSFEYRLDPANQEFFAPKQGETTPTVDENTPKSIPINKNDQYIRKRMIIAGSYYCSNEALSKLSIGAHLQLVAEPSNKYDPNAIMLIYENEKIGYVAKADLPPFTACMRLGREVYGIITDIITKDGITKYEYEAWFVK